MSSWFGTKCKEKCAVLARLSPHETTALRQGAAPPAQVHDTPANLNPSLTVSIFEAAQSYFTLPVFAIFGLYHNDARKRYET